MTVLLTCTRPDCTGCGRRLWLTHPSCPWCAGPLVPATSGHDRATDEAEALDDAVGAAV